MGFLCDELAAGNALFIMETSRSILKKKESRPMKWHLLAPRVSPSCGSCYLPYLTVMNSSLRLECVAASYINKKFD